MKINAFYGSTIHFFKQLWKNGPYHTSVYLKLTIFALRSLLLFPSSLWEQLFRAEAINARQLHEEPLFILGHYRSGTTLLHKLLAKDPQFIYLNGIDCLFPFAGEKSKEKLKPILKWLFRLLKLKNQAFSDYELELDDPVEEDAFMLYANSPYSAFWGLIFARDAEKQLKSYVEFGDLSIKEEWKEAYSFLCKKIAGKKEANRLLLKSPPNTGRIKVLLELFPDAKIIHIVRNPYQVFSSMEKLLVENIEKFYALHPTTMLQKREIIFTHYSFLMDRLETDKFLLQASNYSEVRYEDLLDNPLQELSRIYEELKLGTFSELKPYFKEILQKEAPYSPRSHVLSPDLRNEINIRWGNYFRRWGYDIKQ